MATIHDHSARSPGLSRVFSRPKLRRVDPALQCAGVACLSILLPGLGHLAIGRKRRGIALLTISFLLIGAAILLIPREPFEALSLVVQPRVLIVVFLTNAALLMFRLFAVVDTHRILSAGVSHPGTLTRVAATLVLAVAIALAAAPHAIVAYYDVVTYRVLDDVFDGGSSTVSAPTEVELTRPINLKPGVEAAAPAVTSIPVTGEDDR